MAVAHRRANAVGPVRLTCQPNGLRVDLLRVGRFAPGFAFAGLADARSFRVPYTAIRGMVSEGQLLHLSLDPHAATPYNRFALARFSRDPLATVMRAFRLRALVSSLRYVLPFPLAALAVWAASGGSWAWPSEIGSQWGLAAIALVVSGVVFRVLRLFVGWMTSGGPSSVRLRSDFERAVSVRLGLAPASELGGGPLGVPLPPRVGATPVAALGHAFRPRLFAAAAAVALTAGLVSVHVVQRFGVAEEVSLPVEDAVSGLGAPLLSHANAAVTVGTPEHERCTCDRVESALWRDRLPQLSVLITPIEGHVEPLWVKLGQTYQLSWGGAEPGTFPAGTRPRAVFDLSVVNNSEVTLDTVDLVVTFARRGPRGKRRALLERGLHWPATLGPAESVKWRVKASGRSEFKVDSRHDLQLGDGGLLAAAPDAFFALAQASLEGVRVHGAMMLSYLGDPRAEASARALGQLSPRLEPARGRILQTHVPLTVCDAASGADGMTLCVFNGTDELHRALVVTELGSGQPRRHVLRDLFLPHQGLRFDIDAAKGRRAPTFRVEVLTE